SLTWLRDYVLALTTFARHASIHGLSGSSAPPVGGLSVPASGPLSLRGRGAPFSRADEYRLVSFINKPILFQLYKQRKCELDNFAAYTTISASPCSPTEDY